MLVCVCVCVCTPFCSRCTPGHDCNTGLDIIVDTGRAVCSLQTETIIINQNQTAILNFEAYNAISLRPSDASTAIIRDGNRNCPE